VVPSSLVGVVIFVALLAPGFVYTLRSDPHAPQRQFSIFRESVALIFVSIVCDAIAVALFAVIRCWLPDRTPDVGLLVRDTALYSRFHYASLVLWGTGILIVACLIAYASATPATYRLARRMPLAGRFLPPRRHASYQSGWMSLFHLHALPVHIRCSLDDGSEIAGTLLSANRLESDTADRDLTLKAPITYRPPGAEEKVLPNVNAVSVSARNIRLLFVTALDKGKDPNQ